MKNYFKISLLLLAFFCMNFASYSQDAPNSLGPAPYVLNNAPQSQVFDVAVGTRAFTQISSSPTFQFGKSFLESCTITNIGAPFTITFPGGLVYRNGTVYTWNQSSPFQLWSIDTVTGVHTLVFNMTGVPQANFTGMTWDGTTMYGVSSSLSVSQIFTVNMTTGVCTPIGSPSATCAGAILLAGRNLADAGLFSVDIVLDNLYKWNKTTGVATLVGPLGGNANFGQDGQFDNSDGKLYWMSYITGPALRTIDTATGGGVQLCTYLAQATGIAPVTISAAPSISPELMYYKFENNPSATLVTNCAQTPVGTNPAPLLSTTPLGSGGQFDSCLSGQITPALANLGGVNTGWLTSMPANWTISFWLGPNIVDGNPSYLFGDPGAGSFRCFYGGAAGLNNILLRGFGADILITGVGTTATVLHITYNGTNVLVYKNGVLFGTFPRTASPTGGTGFRVGSYNTAFVSQLIGKLDEFRLYNRALDQAEITATWNSDLAGCGIVGIENTNNQIPAAFSLSQNYPNPFNPVTNIKFAIPTSGNVKLVVFDILGKEVATIVNEVKTAGNYVVDFDASSLSSGVYFYRLESGDFTQTKKMLLVK